MEPKSHLVSSGNFKQVVKKKYSVPVEEQKAWDDFANKIGDIFPKDDDVSKKNINNKVKKLDLHGCSLSEANKVVKKFIIESFDNGYKKLLIVTGKGLRSKSHNNPYLSEKLSVLKYSIPEYINSDENLNNKVIRISEADLKDGGKGAIYIFLKNKKKLENKF